MATNTATSFTNHTGNASAGPFSISFSYLDESEVDVTVDGVLKTKTTHYTFPSATTISFTSGNHPANGAVIKFQRDTNISAKKVDFQDGSVLTEADLDNNSDQILYGLQEFVDSVNNDLLKRDGSQTVTGNLVFEGATDDAHETTLAITDPTADRTITLPNTTGTVVTTGDTGTITSTMINDGTIATADLANNSVTMDKLNSGTLPSDVVVNEDNLAANSVGSSELADDAVDTDAIQDNAVTMAKLNSGALPTDITVASANIVDGTIVTGDIATGTLDGRYYTETELDAGQLDNRYYTETEADARFYNLASTEEIQSGETWVAADNKVATTSAIDNRIVDLVDDVGGFVPIANETSFPNANPDVNNGAGTLVSIKALASNLVSNGSGVATIANGTVGNSTVTITGLANSTTYAATFGMIVETTTTLNTYTFHRQVPKATEVTTVAGSISNINTVAGNNTNINTVAGVSSNVTTVADSITNVNNVGGSIANVNSVASNLSTVNDFAARYRIGSSNPTSSLDTGDLFFNTTANELKVYNGSAWQGGVTATGSFATVTGNTFTGDNLYNDDVKAKFGTGTDFSIFHDGTSNIIDNVSADLHIKHGAEFLAKFTQDGAVELYHDGTLQCKTASYGLDFADNKRADFGDGSDLIIYHDATDSFITNSTGDLWLKTTGDDVIIEAADDITLSVQGGENALIARGDGAVELYYNNAKVFQTASHGLNIYDTADTTVLIQLSTSSGVAGFIEGIGDTQLGFKDNQQHWTVKGIKDGAVELYYDNSKKAETVTGGFTITGVCTATSFAGDGSSLTGISSVGGATGVDFNDDVKARFGTGNDLEIKHAGDHNYIWGTGANSGLTIGTNATSALTVDTSQDININAGDIVFGTAGKGICLGVTSNTDANTLDDYEEGTWTATLTTGSASSFSSTWYRKIGQLVHVHCTVGSPDDATTSANIIINGLPFSAADGGCGSCIFSKHSGSANSVAPVPSGTTVKFLASSANTGSWGYLTHDGFQNTTGGFRFSLTYYAS